MFEKSQGSSDARTVDAVDLDEMAVHENREMTFLNLYCVVKRKTTTYLVN